MCSEHRIEITPETKIGDLLESYPELEELLIEMAPVFSKLKNPILRKTIAKVTAIRQAAAVGNIQLDEMINKLRKSAGHEALYGEQILENAEYGINDKREFENVVLEYDARIDLQEGKHPVGKVMSDLNSLNEGEAYKLITPFTPAPLIDKAKAKGFRADSFRIEDNQYETYFYK